MAYNNTQDISSMSDTTNPSISNDGIHQIFDGDVQYPYADVGAPKLLHISSVTNENRRSYNYTCPYCNKELLPKLGTKRRHCFSHKKGERCDIDKYIHSTAERLLKEKWDSEQPFEVVMTVRRVCKNDNCKILKMHGYQSCVKEQVEHFDLKKWYSDCIVEKKVDDFIPDLCLVDNTGKHDPIFIEIWSKHPCSEKKMSSNHKIIEIRLKTVGELEWLPNHPIVESETVTFNNFDVIKIDPKDIDERPELIKYTLFSDTLKSHLYNKGEAKCWTYHHHHPKAIMEIVAIKDYIYHPNSFWLYCNSLAIEKGYDVRVCQLCQLYNNKEKGCIREFREKGIIIPCDTVDAKSCEQFRLRDRLLKISKRYMSDPVIVWEKKPDGQEIEAVERQKAWYELLE